MFRESFQESKAWSISAYCKKDPALWPCGLGFFITSSSCQSHRLPLEPLYEISCAYRRYSLS